MERETLASRLGFILLSAGCAVGLGNVWRFPYITGQYGGAVFVLIRVSGETRSHWSGGIHTPVLAPGKPES